MTDIVVSLSADLLTRLTAIAQQKELSLGDCARQAVLDYVESWEDFGRTIDLLDSGEEERTVLRAVNE